LLLGLPAWLPAQLKESAGEWKAGEWKQFVTFEVRETAGIAREHEPIEVELRLPVREVRVVRWTMPPEEVVSQVLDAQPDSAALKLRIVFFATVPAKDTVLYRVYFNHPDPPAASYATPLKISGQTRVGWIVENEYYAADASQRTIGGKNEDSGQVRALTIKAAGVTLRRTVGNPRMHWAPNFQRTGAQSYESIATWEPVQSIERFQGPVAAATRRAGSHQDYPEIALNAEYRFFAGVPYFLFHSEMRMTQPIQLFLLRNEEMTMDGFFTHLAWPGKAPAAAVRSARLEEREKILEKEPIPAEALWVCFYNADKGYGLGSVRLKFEVKNAAGKPSPLAHPYTKISDGDQGGRYWNRRLIDERDTMVPAGSRYCEENAYVVFTLRPGPPREAIGEFLEWEQKLRHPLVAELQGTKAWTARQEAKKAAAKKK
jgi:hypothetical protein